jgi:RNA 2',3'-cyclic 3'-phosphodiesterase
VICLRIFVGIDVPKNIKNDLDKETDKFLRYAASAKKVLTDNYHLTLKYIGEIEMPEIDELDLMLKEALKEVHVFDIKIKDFGYFEKKDGLILWIGVLQGVGRLKEIYLKIDSMLSERFSLDRSPFSPHITLAKKVVMEDKDDLRKNKTKDYHFNVHEIIIYYSHIVDNVLTYTPMSSIKLSEG